jgi:hypothetical protein
MLHCGMADVNEANSTGTAIQKSIHLKCKPLAQPGSAGVSIRVTTSFLLLMLHLMVR